MEISIGGSEVTKPLTDEEKETQEKWDQYDIDEAVRTCKAYGKLKRFPNLLKLAGEEAEVEIKSLEQLRNVADKKRTEVNPSNDDSDY